MNKRISTLLIIFATCSAPKRQLNVPVLTGLDGKQYFERAQRSTQAKLDSNLNVAKKNFEAILRKKIISG